MPLKLATTLLTLSLIIIFSARVNSANNNLSTQLSSNAITSHASKIERWLNESQRFLLSDLNHAQVLAEKALKASQLNTSASFQEKELHALLILANIAKINNQQPLLEKHYDDAENILKNLDNDNLNINIYELLTEAIIGLQDYQLALAYCDKWLTNAKKSVDNEQLFLAYSQKANTYKQLKLYDLSLHHYQKAEGFVEQLANADQFLSLKNLAEGYKFVGNPLERIQYLNKALLFIKQNSLEQHETYLLLNLSMGYRQTNQYELAIKSATAALKRAKQESNKVDSAVAYIVMSRVYRRLSSYDLALEYNLKALTLFKKHGDLDSFASAANSLGLIYNHLDQNAQAVKYFESVVALPFNDISAKTLAAALRELALQTFKMGNKEKALQQIQKSYDLYKGLNRVGATISVNKIKGRFYQKMGKRDKALLSYNEALDDARLIRDAWSEADILTMISTLLADTSLKKAQKIALKALEISTKINAKSVSIKAYSSLVDIEERNENYQLALKYSKKKAAISDEIKQNKIKEHSLKMHILNNVLTEVEHKNINSASFDDKL